MNPSRRKAIKVAGVTLAAAATAMTSHSEVPKQPVPGPVIALAGTVRPDLALDKNRHEKPIISGSGFKAKGWINTVGEASDWGWRITFDKPLSRPPVVIVNTFLNNGADVGLVAVTEQSKDGFEVQCINRLYAWTPIQFVVYLI